MTLNLLDSMDRFVCGKLIARVEFSRRDANQSPVPGLAPTVVSPAAKLAGGREVGANYRQRPSKRLPATRV
jgi:hypothetical protein